MTTESKIKSIYIELPDYEFYHGPQSSDKTIANDSRFLGRKKAGDKLKTVLSSTSTYSGTYLVAGFRGMGKTSLVRNAISAVKQELEEKKLINRVKKIIKEIKNDLKNDLNGNKNIFIDFRPITNVIKSIEKKIREDRALIKYKKKKKSIIRKKIIDIETSLAQDEINELNIYKTITRILCQKFKDEYNKTWFKIKWAALYGFLSILSFFSIIIICFGIITFFIDKEIVLWFFSKLDQVNTLSRDYIYILLRPSTFFVIVFIFTLVASFPFAFPSVLKSLYSFWVNNIGIKRNGHKILNRLQNLITHIESQTITETNEGLSPGQSILNFLSKKQEKREPIGERDIENELIDILMVITKEFKYQFVFVFDELDKIEPHFNLSIYEKESENLNLKQNLFYSEEKLRKRREAIIKLFSNMKHFLTVAQAKFVFIAGREMYDAALADISDRESYIGSIFHDVIYVGSFMRESYFVGSTDITKLTEEYVCQFLIPEYIKVQEKDIDNDKKCYPNSLKGFNNYLDKEYKGDKKHSDWDQIKDKIIVTLQTFIIYLTYRSNGAPKKITQLFEKHLTTTTIMGKIEDIIGRSILIRNNDNVPLHGTVKSFYYLYFDPEQQYRFNYTAKLFTPFLVTKSRYMRYYGDKLLIAATYILDHLYKFHNSAFSWGNLELTPEIIAINKSPELRGFIKDMMNDLENAHIRKINSGLYDFRFNKLISLEIDYLSKSFPEESAAFNFTLDESLEIKRHYTRKLKEVKSEFYKRSGQTGFDYSYSIGFMHAIMGDLHLYDQEFDEAVINYHESIESLLSISEEKFYKNTDYFVIYIKTALKLGLAYEKMNHFNLAFATYRQISDRVLIFANPGVNTRYKQPKDAVNEYTNETIAYLRLLYQSNLAKLALYEKTGLNSIVRADVEKALEEFNGIYKNQRDVLKNNPLIQIEYYGKLGDILFYKNSFFVPHIGTKYIDIFIDFFDKDKAPADNNFRAPLNALAHYLCALEIFCLRIVDNDYSEGYYNDLMNNPFAKYKKFQYLQFINKANEYLVKPSAELKNPIRKQSLLKSAANLLSKIGDALLCCSDENDFLDYVDLIKVLVPNDYNNSVFAPNSKSKLLATVFLCYRISAGLFEKCNDMSNRAFQFRKILYTLKESLSFNRANCKLINCNITEYGDLIKFLEEKILTKLLKSSYKIYKSAGRVDLLKYEGITNKNFHTDTSGFKNILGKIASSAENDEIKFLMLEIKLKIKAKYLDSVDYNFGRVLHPHSIINNQYNRVLALLHQLHLNYIKFKEIVKEGSFNITLIPPKVLSICETNENVWEKIQKVFPITVSKPDGNYIHMDHDIHNLVVDSLYCCTEAIKILKIWGISLPIGHSFHAFIHEKMGDWCFVFSLQNSPNNINERSFNENGIITEKSDKDYTDIEYLVGSPAKQFLDYNYHYECALRHYYDMTNSHNEGDSYKNFIEDKFYLEDDFAEPQSMFGAALERYQINNSVIKNKIEGVKEKIKITSRLYDIENYY